MKFGAQIKSRVAALEAFISRDAFIDYDGLKRIIDDGMNESSKRLTWRREFHELYLEEIRRVRSFLEGQAQGHFIADVFGSHSKARVPLNVLLDFVELNKAGFDKITKKFDKVPGRGLGPSPCHSPDPTASLADRVLPPRPLEAARRKHRHEGRADRSPPDAERRHAPNRATRVADEASSLRHFCLRRQPVGTRESSSPWRCARSRSGSEARRDTSETLPRHFRDTFETLPRHFREPLPRHFRDTSGALMRGLQRRGQKTRSSCLGARARARTHARTHTHSLTHTAHPRAPGLALFMPWARPWGSCLLLQ